MKEDGYEVNAESVIDQLLKRLSQVELENASLKAALNQFVENKQNVTKEGE